MATNILDKKYSLKSLLQEYSKIEIPILQRDYAQGRKDKKTGEIRKKILKYILESLENGEAKELDFVYGAERTYKDKNDNTLKAFIPLDGQQRLTTLWLLYWYLAYRNEIKGQEQELIKEMLEKFTYENRTSSKDFMKALCNSSLPQVNGLSDYIVNQTEWFDEAWLLDPSINGFLTMLDSFENHEIIKKPGNLKKLYDGLVNQDLVTFYFLPLRNFGLGEEIYTRMNARGKVLNEFEEFKSNFYKIIGEASNREEITRKIEYDWVKNLWDYRPDKMYIVDAPFMNWLRFITQMLYIVNPSDEISDEKVNNIDFLSFDILEKIYSNEDNLKFLVHSFDRIPDMAGFKSDVSLTWTSGKYGLKPALKEILTNEKADSIIYSLVVFAVLKFMEIRKDDKNKLVLTGLNDYLRVIRNLIENTTDRSKREWPKIIQSLENLISDNVYVKIQQLKSNELQGLRVEQRNLEVFKASAIYRKEKENDSFIFNKDSFDIFTLMDDDDYIKARETNFIIALHNNSNPQDKVKELDELDAPATDIATLKKLYSCYNSLRNFGGYTDFNGIWGDLLPTSFYESDSDTCKWDNGSNANRDFPVCKIIVNLAIDVLNNNCDAEDTILKRQKTALQSYFQNIDPASILEVKKQLYILYIATIRCVGTQFTVSSISDFFVKDRYNFAWVDREKGYSSPFEHMIASDKAAKIYQTIPSYLRKDEIKDWRTPKILFAHQRKNNFFDHLIKWANS